MCLLQKCVVIFIIEFSCIDIARDKTTWIFELNYFWQQARKLSTHLSLQAELNFNNCQNNGAIGSVSDSRLIFHSNSQLRSDISKPISYYAGENKLRPLKSFLANWPLLLLSQIQEKQKMMNDISIT